MSRKRINFYIGLSVWLVCAIFYMYEFFLRTIVGTFQTSIVSDLRLSTITFALVSSTAYQVVYSCMQVPVGFLTDYFGLKKALFSAVIFCAIAALGFSFSQSFISAINWRILMGLGSSFGFVCLLVAVYDWMPKKNIGLFIGLSQFIGTLGPMLAAGPLHSLSQHAEITWRMVFMILSLLGLALAVLVFLVVKNNRDKDQTHSFTVLNKTEPVKTSLKKLFSQRTPWIIGIVSAGLYFTIEYFSENQTQQYLALYGYSAAFATYLITLAWLGYAIGCPLLGFISDFYRRRKLPMVIAGFIILASLSIIIYSPINKFLLLISFFMLGIGCSGQSIGFAMMSEYCESSYLAAGLGFNNGALVIFTAVSAPLVGEILIRLSGGNSNTFTISQYHIGFSLLYLIVILAVFLAVFFMKETFCKSQKDLTLLTQIKQPLHE